MRSCCFASKISFTKIVIIFPSLRGETKSSLRGGGGGG
jgi:hypothetical protein